MTPAARLRIFSEITLDCIQESALNFALPRVQPQILTDSLSMWTPSRQTELRLDLEPGELGSLVPGAPPAVQVPSS